jgi:hypothetical protein
VLVVVVVVIVVSLSGLMVVDVVVVVVDGGGGDGGGPGEAGVELDMPKGVSSSLTFEEDATPRVAECCGRGDCALAWALSLR